MPFMSYTSLLLYSSSLFLLLSLSSCVKKPLSQGTISQDVPESQTQKQEPLQSIYRNIDAQRVEGLNWRVRENKIDTPKGIMQLYAPKDLEAEGRYSYLVDVKTLLTGIAEVLLTEEGLMDDSIAARKVLMRVQRTEEGYVVLSIQESYKCREGRGHQDWASSFCN